MEENKKAKTIKMDNIPEERAQKMSYEQLENVAHQLSEQARQLYLKLQEADLNNMFKRLDYLFKIVENSSSFDEDFITKCVAEIKDLMTFPEQKEDPKE